MTLNGAVGVFAARVEPFSLPFAWWKALSNVSLGRNGSYLMI